MSYPQYVMITEVGPRDGLQNESIFVATADKVTFIQQLQEAGFSQIEVSSFVSPQAIPQLADASAIFKSLSPSESVRYLALVPNEQGMQNALSVGVKNIAIFTAASEQFNQRNIRCSIAESIQRFKPVIHLAQTHNIRIRAYISCALGCPYEGAIAPQQVVDVLDRLLDLNIDEVSLGDTIGVGTAKQTALLLDALLKKIPTSQMIMHFHDTYGQAISNIYTSLGYGVYQFDSAAAGLGGCPYARGATGNVATEDVLYLMHGLGIETGIDLFKVVEAGDRMCKILNKRNQSKVANALLAQGG